jgi:hypothetical protein
MEALGGCRWTKLLVALGHDVTIPADRSGDPTAP